MNKKTVYTTLAVVVLALLTQLPGSPMAVFSYERIDPSAKEYVIPAFAIEISGLTLEEILESEKTSKDLYEKVWGGPNGELMVLATSAQAQAAAERTNRTLELFLNQAENKEKGYRIEINEYRTAFIYLIDQYAPPVTAHNSSRLVMATALSYQIYHGVPPEECAVTYTYYDIEKDEVFYQSTYPMEPAYFIHPPDIGTGTLFTEGTKILPPGPL